MNKRKTIVIFILLIVILNIVESIGIKRSSGNSNLKTNIQKAENILNSQQLIFLTLIDQLMLKYQIVNNHQYSKCFTLQEINKLDLIVKSFLQIGFRMTEDQLQLYPQTLVNLIHKEFTLSTIQCFKNSNDLKWLLKQYKLIYYEQISSTFSKYSISNFRFLHQTFTKFIILWENRHTSTNQIFILLDKSLETIYKQQISDDEWGILVQNPHLANYTYYGISTSNGLIGAVSDKYPLKVHKTVLAGAYDKYGRGRVDNIIQTMNVIDMQLRINDKTFNTQNMNVNYMQYINFKKSQFQGSYSFTNQASVNYKYSALKNNPTVFYTQVEITAHSNIQIQVKNYHRVPDYLNDVQKTYENIPSKEIYRVITTKATTKKNKIDIVISSTFVVSEQSKQFLVQGDNYGHQDWDSEMHLHLLTNIKLRKGQIFKFYLFSSLISSEHHSDPQNEAIRLLIKAASTENHDLISKHYLLWENLWKNDIIVEGNSQDQKFIRSMVYHFYSFINEFKHYGLSPMGLSGLGYNGHVFWDMDLWMYPAILVLNPALAKSLIQYRYERLKQAENNAFLNGYKGAMFPWQSSKKGDEQTPVWAAPGPLQHHVTGTVAFAAWNYYCVTQDKQWLKDKGFEIIDGAAQFWVSRVQKDSQGKYHIKNVVAADEWAENVDDDAFTNGIAIETLKIANKARSALGMSTKSEWDQIRLNIIIYHFPDTNITREHASYNGQNIKQADVNLLSFPLKQVVNKDNILKDLEYYESRVPTQGTPAMTHAIFALLYSRLGNAQKAEELFKYSYRNNLLQPFKVLAETQGGTNPYFLTGAGGILQCIIFGFAGLDITDQGIKTVQTVIPNSWSRVIVKNQLNRSQNIQLSF